MNRLFTWIDLEDLQAAGIKDGTPKIVGGPILSALTAEKFDSVHLLVDWPSTSNSYRKWLSKYFSGEITVNEVDLGADPTDVTSIYKAAKTLLDDIYSSQEVEGSPSFHLTPGTWAMAVVWVIISQTRYTGRLLQASKEAGVQTVDIPFEVHAEFIAKLMEPSDQELISKNAEKNTLNFGNIPFRSEIMQRLAAKAAKASKRSLPILIEGDVGTEKDEFARAIHDKGLRKERKFQKLSCNNTNIADLREKLFGQANIFKNAENGTIYFEDIHALPLALQSELCTKIKSDFRIPEENGAPRANNKYRLIASSCKNLVDQVADGLFHEELFFTLSVLVLQIPSLRERRNDISPLIDQILDQINSEDLNEIGSQVKRISPSARSVLIQRDWKANTRELENAIRRAAIWTDNDVISEDDIWDTIFEQRPTAGALHNILDVKIEKGFNLKAKLDEIAYYLIDRAVEHEKGNKSNAAKLLGFPTYQAFAYWEKRKKKNSKEEPLF